jgi:putative pyruvate formate lyase activating enzyme
MVVAGIERERLALADQHLDSCSLCEHRCGVSRRAGERGPCKVGCEARVFRHRVELGEEVELIPSHLFYLSGCDLRCCFCIAESNAFSPASGTELTGEFLANAIPWGRTQGARNIQWVGGEPTIHIPAILRLEQRSASKSSKGRSCLLRMPRASAEKCPGREGFAAEKL